MSNWSKVVQSGGGGLDWAEDEEGIEEVTVPSTEDKA